MDKKTMNIEDLLDEDPSIPSQTYGIISYLLPDPEKNELAKPNYYPNNR